jgi:hypothetical protein
VKAKENLQISEKKVEHNVHELLTGAWGPTFSETLKKLKVNFERL